MDKKEFFIQFTELQYGKSNEQLWKTCSNNPRLCYGLETIIFR